MPTEQHPIASGFTRWSTVSDVVADVDLTGRLAVVTGGYSGIGLEHVKGLSAAGATVIVPARRPAVAAEQLAGLAHVEVAELDLGDPGSVERFAEPLTASGRSVDILLNGAGVMAAPETRVSPGWELQLAVNHLGHFALANRLWSALAAEGGARVVAVSSVAHRIADMQWDDLQSERRYDKWSAYGQSKTANVLFALQLDLLGADAGVRAFSLHPGGIRTPLQRHLPEQEEVALGWKDEDGNDLIAWKTPAQGAATAVWAATSPQLQGCGGVYLEDCDIAEVADPDSPAATRDGVHPHAVDRTSAARLWAVSAELTGVDAFASGA